MKQLFRFILKPWTFFAQLQWSTHHWIILIAFFGVTVVETLVGRQHSLFQVYANFLQQSWGLSWNQALWLILVGKMVVMVTGAYLVASIVYLVGNMFGQRHSRRVLFRRLAVVFTVLLSAYTAQHFAKTMPVAGFVSALLYLWGLFLGFWALREQFSLNNMETAVLGLFALLLVTSTWHLSNHILEATADAHLHELAKRPINTHLVAPPRSGPKY